MIADQPKPPYEDADETFIGVCWGCETVILERVDESVVQSTMQYHSKENRHHVSVFHRTKNSRPGFGVHCNECGYTRRFDSQNADNPERSARSAKAGHTSTECSKIVQVVLYE